MSFEPPTENLIAEAFPEVSGLALLEKGGFKAVYRASIRGKQEAFKLLSIPSYAGHADAEALRSEMFGRVQREVGALMRCVGSEIVKLGGLPLTEVKIAGEDYVGYSEEFLNGQDLWRILNSGGPKPAESELKQLFRSLLKGILELWTKGYIHRDIKPKNVMKLQDLDRPFVLLDLGIAYSILDTGLTANPSERMPMATYRYLAPEMMNPSFRETIDYRSDLYTAAMTVFEYGAQRHPLAHDRDDLMRTISRAIRQPATPLQTIRPDLSPAFCRLIDQMLKKKPALRPGNLRQLISEMEENI
jgi:serine/threonine protein kinase